MPPTPPLSPDDPVYILRVVRVASARRGFRILVRPVGSERWLGFTDPHELMAFLLREAPNDKDEAP